MKIVVVGAGGLGGYFGARLAAGGNDVTFIARGRHLQAILRDGLRVESNVSPLLLRRVQATDYAEGASIADLVILAVKLWDTDVATRSIVPLIGPHTIVVSFQNGVDAATCIADVVGIEHVIGGVAYIATAVERPGVIRHSGTMQRLIFGEFDGSPTQRVNTLSAACLQAGIDYEVHTDIRRAIWEKFVFLVGLSATTCLFRSNIGLVRSHKRSRALLLEILREAEAVGRACGVALAPSFADDRLAFIDTLPDDMLTSMYTDLQHGRRLELPWLSGRVAQLGEEYNVSTPGNSFVTDAMSLDVCGRPYKTHAHRSRFKILKSMHWKRSKRRWCPRTWCTSRP